MIEKASTKKSDLASVLKIEVARLARKEIRAELEPIKKASANMRSQIAALRAENSDLEKQVRQLTRALNKHMPLVARGAAPSEEGKSNQRFTAKVLTSLRERLGLSCAQMGKLIGASDQSVRKWEAGTSIPREPFQQAIFALRGMGKREIAKRLAEPQ